MRIENKIAISILIILVGFPCFVFASTSANYENSSETVSAAGGTSSSANVSTSGTVGEVATGTSGSTNYQSSAGFPSNAEPQSGGGSGSGSGGGGGAGAVGPLAAGISALLVWWKRRKQRQG